jgi:Diadenosine tetraphosphate (Ap4A) hydrolase and other HIT family hydrolases
MALSSNSNGPRLSAIPVLFRHFFNVFIAPPARAGAERLLMERLWAPWRLAYVAGDKGKKATPAAPAGAAGCVFCDRPAMGPAHDAESGILTRGEACYAILNAYPYNNGHLMVIPYRHIASPAELTPEEGSEMMALCAFLTDVLKEAYGPDGYNIGMNVGSAAGAGIAAHLHLHIVPRWSGDTNFMPVVGGVKVMPETLEQTYTRLQTILEARLQGASAGGDSGTDA